MDPQSAVTKLSPVYDVGVECLDGARSGVSYKLRYKGDLVNPNVSSVGSVGLLLSQHVFIQKLRIPPGAYLDTEQIRLSWSLFMEHKFCCRNVYDQVM